MTWAACRTWVPCASRRTSRCFMRSGNAASSPCTRRSTVTGPGGGGRYQRELIPPAEYLRMSYYERWLSSLSELLIKSGMVTRRELETGVAEGGNTKGRHMLRANAVAAMIAAGSPSTRDVPVAAKFREGQRVRARDINPVGHTRLPRYARGKQGSIV